MHLRQVAIVAHELDPVRDQIFNVLGLSADYEDPGIIEFGLRNSVMSVGNTFLEIVSPVEEGTTAGRLLARRGDGGYMVLGQTDDIGPVSRRIDELGIRKVWEADRAEVTAFHVHPKDIGAAIVSFDEMRPAEEWIWAGPNWREQRARNVSTISAVDIQADDPEEIARRWSGAFGHDVHVNGDQFEMPLESGHVYFMEAADGRGDGVSGIQFDVADKDKLLEAINSSELILRDNETEICGTVFRFQGL